VADSVRERPGVIRFDAERTAVAGALSGFCDRYLDGVSRLTSDAIRYSLLGEGKRLRGVLLVSAYHAAGGTGDASKLAAAVEVVHAYSLVHDDLPCMDDDDVRRGRPTVHRVFGVRVATAAGLAMVPLATRCAFDAALDLGLTPANAAAIVRELMVASGAGGMIGGQLLDLEAEGLALTLGGLERIHRAKTGALIAASVTIGGRAAGASPSALTALARYGAAIGLAFQIADDVLDVTATTDELGKTAGRDLALNKSTYPALLGVEGAIARAAALIDEACEAADGAGLLTPALERLARFIIERRS
jgi:farnesyl diphosphate synthase/geranylgeranyl diphosphate synthase type II